MDFGNHSSTQTCTNVWNIFVIFFVQNKTGVKYYLVSAYFSLAMVGFNYKQEKRNFPQIIQYAPIKLFYLLK